MIVYLYFKDKISWKLWTNVLFFLHFSVFFMKNVSGYSYLKTHKKNSIDNNTALFFFFFFRILNVKMSMMLLVQHVQMYVVFLIFTKKKSHKIKNFPQKKVPTNLWIWTHILVLERQLTSNLYFFNY
jgi:chromate transport protein ChrA